ncbi:hypothetical protein FHX49_000490 [Microbacterium endophyticum]|uniref:Uncharacterized protein n=1 Tax=Microbacterium endophyticum TaxID=1526412 RepID=A0A7W4YLX8_9MICO|nr:hypothetical protein [Microbacterium endophyticum]MBB2974949.1 hypothetical protein [Microbacterium endophyticum]NIK37246.1 hypothetical protein [Microbacterium endophyticum]
MTDEVPRASWETPILERLAEVGFEFRSLAELRSSGVRYRGAIPILIEALRATTEPRALEQIVRALSVPWAKPAATPELIEVFRRVDDASGLGPRWAVGNALEVTCLLTFCRIQMSMGMR